MVLIMNQVMIDFDNHLRELRRLGNIKFEEQRQEDIMREKEIKRETQERIMKEMNYYNSLPPVPQYENNEWLRFYTFNRLLLF